MTAAAGRAIRDGLTFRPVQPRRARRRAPRSGASRINDYIGRLEPAARSRARPTPSPACSPISRRPTRTASWSATRPDPRRAGWRADRGVRVGGRPRAAVVPVDAVRAARSCRAPASAGRCSTGSLPDRRRPRCVRATATDSAQPISNALYASLGIVPRMPLLNLIGLPSGPKRSGPLPSGIRPVPFERIAGGPADGAGHRMLADAVDALDRELLGVAHPDRSPLPARRKSRRGWLYRGPDGAPRRLRLRRARPVGSGPVAVRDADLLAPVLGHLTRAVVPRGAFAMWLPGHGRSGGRGRAAGRLPARPVPRPAVLGPPVRRLRRATCRSRRACSDRPPPSGRLRTGPSSGAPVHRPSRLPDAGAGGSLGPDVAPPAVPADGVEPMPADGDDRRRSLRPRSRT